MALTEIEFELPAHQYQNMGYPGLKQGEALTVLLDAGVLLPDPAAESWFAVQQAPWPTHFKRVGAATYAFSGQIQEAHILNEAGEESATLLVACGEVPLRVTCGPQVDGRLPYGTWETRDLAGYAHLQGIVEEGFTTPIGKPVGVTIWSFRRPVLTPGDPVFAQWHETDQLPPTPYHYDRVFITAHLHRTQI